MKLRIIVQTADHAAAANVGGPVIITCQTFDVEATPELAAHVALGLGERPDSYQARQIIGVEVLKTGEQP